MTRRATLILAGASSSSARIGVSAKVLKSEAPSATITAVTWIKRMTIRALNIQAPLSRIGAVHARFDWMRRP
jgi:hypothetical protein